MQKRATTEAIDAIWDVAVIGGGPAGMMAAGQAASRGARVVLLEKNDQLGKKLLITGGGRCNVTNAESDNKKLLAKFKESGKYLFSPFSQWSVQETLDFFHEKQMPTKVEAEQRVFPLSNKSQSVWDTLVAFLKDSGVTVISNAPVIKLHAKNNLVSSAELRKGRQIHAKNFILATGGTSHPETGSTGDGYVWLRELGHTVSEASAALVPIALREPAKNASGVALSNVKITLFQNEVKQGQRVGKMLFTHVGMSGPAILNMSRDIGELLKYGQLFIEIDLLPEMGYEVVNEKLQQMFALHANKKVKNALPDLVPTALTPLLFERAEIDPETPCNSVTRDARIRLMKILKHLRFEAKGLLGMNKAVITAGGVSLDEVDLKTMRSLKVENLFLVGDILNVDRPSGGYSLQLCWTTGYVAGVAASGKQD
ncbi:MAG: NAD(P)/FAD-dependent oxidoreductase [Patescibacteria group bacterium]